MTIKIAVINNSTVLSDAEVANAVPALQKQIDRDAGPVWGISAMLSFIPKSGQPAPDEWWLAVLDNSDQAGALGYHDLTDSGLPLSKVFAGSDLAYHQSWTVTCSHELLEMLVDPNINLAVFEEGPLGARLYAYEICDACEADEFGYEIDGVLVSDFVYPAWFESFRAKASTQFDFAKKIQQPFQLLSGGYIGLNDIASGLGWTQVTAEDFNVRATPPAGSRRQRRDVPPPRRQRSDVFSGSVENLSEEASIATPPSQAVSGDHLGSGAAWDGEAACDPHGSGPGWND